VTPDSPTVGRHPATTVGAGLIGLLRQLDVETVFGIPGVHTLELFRGIHLNSLRHVLNRHEQAAVFAADGYSRVTGRPGVALLISGPGVTNAATAIAQAYHDSIPLLTISAVSSPPRLGAALHELPDQHALMSAITAFTAHVTDPAELPAALARAAELFASQRPRPVHIQVPHHVLQEPAPSWPKLAVTGRRPSPAPQAVTAAASLLAEASRPIIILGGGAADAGASAAALAERLGAPVAMTLNAKGALPDEHPLSLGTTLPCQATIAAIREADVVLAAGTEFCDVDYYYAEEPLTIPGHLIRVDLASDQLNSAFPASVAIHSDSADALQALDYALAARTGPPAAADGRQRAQAIRSRRSWWPRATPLLPLVNAIGDVLPADAIVTADSTQLAYIGQNAWPARRPRSWLIPSGLGTLGPALPMAIGAAIGAPARPVLCVTGDGGLLYSLQELATVADLALPLTILLYNNSGYGEIRDEMDLAEIPHIGTEAGAHDFPSIARAFGIDAATAQSLQHLQQLLTAGFTIRRPKLIEIGADIP
jgi:thiamine pyrophosphate-dependent acetolactate synthase large subunit-like protein